MTKEIYKYPYNAITEDEIKIFLSDQIWEQVVKITYRNGQIFCTIKDRVSSKNKEIKKLYYQLLLFSVHYWVCLQRHGQSEFHHDSLRLLKLIVQLRNTFLNMLQRLIRA
jgi:hypothetical protein